MRRWRSECLAGLREGSIQRRSLIRIRTDDGIRPEIAGRRIEQNYTLCRYPSAKWIGDGEVSQIGNGNLRGGRCLPVNGRRLHERTRRDGAEGNSDYREKQIRKSC
jgi:hypothetical protein